MRAVERVTGTVVRRGAGVWDVSLTHAAKSIASVRMVDLSREAERREKERERVVTLCVAVVYVCVCLRVCVCVSRRACFRRVSVFFFPFYFIIVIHKCCGAQLNVSVPRGVHASFAHRVCAAEKQQHFTPSRYHTFCASSFPCNLILGRNPFLFPNSSKQV
jgi:hypothetical protein